MKFIKIIYALALVCTLKTEAETANFDENQVFASNFECYTNLLKHNKTNDYECHCYGPLQIGNEPSIGICKITKKTK